MISLPPAPYSPSPRPSHSMKSLILMRTPLDGWVLVPFGLCCALTSNVFTSNLIVFHLKSNFDWFIYLFFLPDRNNFHICPNKSNFTKFLHSPPSPKQSHSGNSTGRRLFCWGLRLAPFSCFLTLVILWLIHFCQHFVIWGTFLIHGETQGTYARQERSLKHAIGLTLVKSAKTSLPCIP